MTIEHVDSYRLLCDECGGEYEVNIWGDAGYAEDLARDSDWLVREGLVLCSMCWEAKPYCRDEDDKCLRRDYMTRSRTAGEWLQRANAAEAALARVAREGFPRLQPDEFVARFFVEAQGMTCSDEVTRIEWRYLDDEAGA